MLCAHPENCQGLVAKTKSQHGGIWGKLDDGVKIVWSLVGYHRASPVKVFTSHHAHCRHGEDKVVGRSCRGGEKAEPAHCLLPPAPPAYTGRQPLAGTTQ